MEILIHTIKALKYRFKKVITGSSESFGDLKIDDSVRTPNEIINHMYDLTTKTKTMITEGHFNCSPPVDLKFEANAQRFLTGLDELVKLIMQRPLPEKEAKKLMQGPIIDIATHIGQIAMLNGLNGNKIPKENYYAVDLE